MLHLHPSPSMGVRAIGAMEVAGVAGATLLRAFVEATVVFLLLLKISDRFSW